MSKSCPVCHQPFEGTCASSSYISIRATKLHLRIEYDTPICLKCSSRLEDVMWDEVAAIQKANGIVPDYLENKPGVRE